MNEYTLYYSHSQRHLERIRNECFRLFQRYSSPLRFPAKSRRRYNKNPLHTWRNWKNIIQITRCLYCESDGQRTSLLSSSQENTFSTLKILNKKSQHHIKTSQIFALRKRRDTFNNSLLSLKIRFLLLSWYSTPEEKKCYRYRYIYSKIKIDLFIESSIYYITLIMTFYKEHLVIFTFSFISWFYVSFISQFKDLAIVEFKHTSNSDPNDVECIKCKLNLNEWKSHDNAFIEHVNRSLKC